MVKKGSLVKFTGKGKAFPPGKHLFVHDAKPDKVVVWDQNAKGMWVKKNLKPGDVEEVVE